MELPSDVQTERQSMTQWSDRVGYIGAPAPAIGAPWRPPFTVGMQAVTDRDDLARLLTSLGSWGPTWRVLRPCKLRSCPCQLLNQEINDKLFLVVRYELAVEVFFKKYSTIPCHTLDKDEDEGASRKKRKTSQ